MRDYGTMADDAEHDGSHSQGSARTWAHRHHKRPEPTARRRASLRCYATGILGPLQEATRGHPRSSMQLLVQTIGFAGTPCSRVRGGDCVSPHTANFPHIGYGGQAGLDTRVESSGSSFARYGTFRGQAGTKVLLAGGQQTSGRMETFPAARPSTAGSMDTAEH